jgi:hypothetical protein
VLMPKPNRRLSMPLQLISFVNDSYNLLRFSPGPTSFYAGSGLSFLVLSVQTPIRNHRFESLVTIG